MVQTVVQIVQHLRPGGIEVLALELMQEMKPSYDTYIISLEGTKESALESWPALQAVEDRLIFLDKPDKISLMTVWRLIRELKRLKAKTIHTHHLGPLLYGGIAAGILNIRQHIHTEHDIWHLYNTKHRSIQNMLFRLFSPIVVADSTCVSQGLQNMWPELPVTLIYNGVDTQKFSAGCSKHARSQLGLPPNNFIIGCSGRLEEVKDHQILLNILTSFPPSYHIALAGDGSLRTDLEKLSDTLNIRDRIHFLGHQDNMQLFYQAIDVFCLPSQNEGLPLSLLEAQSASIPVISSNVGSCEEAVCPATGALFPAGDSKHLLSCLTKVITQVLCRKHDGNPRQHIVQNFSLERMVNEYSTLIERGQL